MPVRYQAALRPDKKSLNNGIMEHWNTGWHKEGPFFVICLNPPFQHCMIPLFPSMLNIFNFISKVQFILDNTCITSKLNKKHCQRQVDVLKKLYSGTLDRSATMFPDILQRAPQLKIACSPFNIKKNRFIKFWKHTHLPI